MRKKVSIEFAHNFFQAYCIQCRSLCRELHMPQTAFDILMFLANNPAYDTARDIVERRHLAKSHVSAGIEALAGRGLLERWKRADNRKTIHLRLTEAAGPVVAEGRAVQRQYGELLLTGLSEEERGELARLLGSDALTEAALSNAREMRAQALGYKEKQP